MEAFKEAARPAVEDFGERDGDASARKRHASNRDIRGPAWLDEVRAAQSAEAVRRSRRSWPRSRKNPGPPWYDGIFEKDDPTPRQAKQVDEPAPTLPRVVVEGAWVRCGSACRVPKCEVVTVAWLSLINDRYESRAVRQEE